jgi:replicative DNA helicase
VIERTILSNLVYNEEYGRKVLPFIKDEYFSDMAQRTAFDLINEHVVKYNEFPTKESLQIDLSNKDDLNQQVYQDTQDLISNLDPTVIENKKLDWLLDQTEKFCQDRAIFQAIHQSIKILDDKTGKMTKGAIPKLLQDALAVSFHTEIGHDFIEDADKRFDYYHTDVDRIPFDLEFFNKITNGGLPDKTLTVFLAGVNVGKTQLMCHCAGNNLRDGFNVLYITLEMSQEEIAKRIDANLLDVAMDDLAVLPKDVYDKKIQKLRDKTKGKLIVKEYPTSQGHVGHFRHLLNELRLKKNFIPDIIYIDYINICASSRIKRGQANSYEYIKAIAEEMRGLAVEFEVPIATATQLNRTGFKSSDIDMTDTAESFGLPATADLMIGMVITEELEELGQIMCKQLKNRLGSKHTNKRFIIGVDRAKMRFHDVDQSAQEDLLDGPTFDNSKFGEEENERNKPKSKFDFKSFR